MNSRIKEIRKENKLTQADFGERIGVKGNTIGNYELGLRNPTDAVVLSICREFNVREEWLRFGNGPKKEDNIEFGKICREIGVKDPKAKQAILDYWELSPESKKIWWDWVEKFIK